MIGIFDSGIGGLTVTHAVRQLLPGHDMVYFGDTARTPYGSKSPETVTQYALENIRFLLSKGAKVIIAACNTASSVVDQGALHQFDTPVFEVITPAVDRAVSVSVKGRFGIIGTRTTIQSGVYEQRIKEKCPAARTYSVPCPLLVPLVEEDWLKKPETVMIVKKYLHPLKVRQIDTLILGCTHYPLLKKVIQRKIGKRIHIVDSSLAMAETVKAFLAHRPEIDRQIPKTGTLDFFVSDLTDQFQKIAGRIFKRKVSLAHVAL